MTTRPRLARLVFGMTLLAAGIGQVFVLLDIRGGNAWLQSQLPYLIAFVAFPIVGYILASRRPDNALGWLVLAIAATFALDQLLGPYSLYASHRGGGLVALAAAIDGPLWVPVVGLGSTFLLLLFPTGHLPSPRWRWFARMLGSGLILLFLAILLTPGPLENSGIRGLQNPIGLSSFPGIHGLGNVLTLLLPIGMIGSAMGLLGRFRRSSMIDRLQLRWLATAAGIVAGLAVFAVPVGLAYGWTGNRPGWVQAIQAVMIASFALIPSTIAVAVLKYRLYDIDVVVNKTLVYGLLSGSLALVYVALVLGLGGVARSVGASSQSPLVVATSTLTAAALFRPLRRRVQSFIDRRFYRRRYDAQRTLEAFGGRLRDEVDLDELSGHLLATVRDTVQPSNAWLWLRIDGGGVA